MDWQEVWTGLATLIGGGGVGAIALKLAQLWLTHRRAVDGDFETRSNKTKDNFQTVVDNLTSQTAMLLTRIRELDSSNAQMRKEYETRLRVMQDEIDDLRRENQDINCRLHDREIVLLVEDQEFDVMLVRGVLRDMMKRTGLELTVVGTLAKAKRYEKSACVIIADVVLPDTAGDPQFAKLLAMIKRAGCPVVIHACDNYADGAFPGAFGVVKKHESADNLLSVVEAAVRKSRSERGA